MAKFHINPRGDVGRCFSQEGNCPFGGEHFSDLQSAWAHTETLNKDSVVAPILKKVKKVSFAPGEQAELQELLAKLPKNKATLHHVKDNWGDTSSLVSGELNGQANWLMKNGQCLGYAEELSKVLGTERMAVVHTTEDSDEILWDEIADEPILDDDGEEIMEKYENIVHAYAIDKNGAYWDIDGKHESDKFQLSSIEQLTEYSTKDALSTYKEYMIEQDSVYASSLIKPMLEEHLTRP